MPGADRLSAWRGGERASPGVLRGAGVGNNSNVSVGERTDTMREATSGLLPSALWTRPAAVVNDLSAFPPIQSPNEFVVVCPSRLDVVSQQ